MQRKEVHGDVDSLTDENKVLVEKQDEFFAKARHLMEQYSMHGVLIAVQSGEENEKQAFFPSSGLCEIRCSNEAMPSLLFVMNKTLEAFKGSVDERTETDTE